MTAFISPPFLSPVEPVISQKTRGIKQSILSSIAKNMFIVKEIPMCNLPWKEIT